MDENVLLDIFSVDEIISVLKFATGKFITLNEEQPESAVKTGGSPAVLQTKHSIISLVETIFIKYVQELKDQRVAEELKVFSVTSDSM
jgi:hypothetical protein